jgi:hypothetical protein
MASTAPSNVMASTAAPGNGIASSASASAHRAGGNLGTEPILVVDESGQVICLMENSGAPSVSGKGFYWRVACCAS